jgi:hypothetical protein
MRGSDLTQRRKAAKVQKWNRTFRFKYFLCVFAPWREKLFFGDLTQSREAAKV